jgi:flagellar motility protein MotE (MotC chaperone)
MARPSLLRIAIGAAVVLVLLKAERLVAPFRAAPMAATAAAPAAPAATPAAATAPSPAPPAPEAAAERAVLEALRARRAEIEAREHAAAQREVMLAAAERRLMARVEELTALQSRLEALERERAAREDAGLRGLVKLYEGMRPRDAALIFDELDMPVLLSIVDRMREAKAAPVLGAMRPERARALTSELAKLRAQRMEQQAARQ